MSKKPKVEGVDSANIALAMTRTRVKFSQLYMSAKALHAFVAGSNYGQVGRLALENGLGLSVPISM